MEFECFSVRYKEGLYIADPGAGLWVLTGYPFGAKQSHDRPTQEDLAGIAESLGISVSDLSIVKRTVFETAHFLVGESELPSGLGPMIPDPIRQEMEIPDDNL